MTVKELMKILAGMPGDLEIMLNHGDVSVPLDHVERTDTTDDGELLWLRGPVTFEDLI